MTASRSQSDRPAYASSAQKGAQRARTAVPAASISGVGWLQRTYGNQAVLQLLSAQRASIVPWWRPSAAVQRNEKSAELLKAMATPQVKPGPTIEVQDQIVEALEKKIAEELPQPDSSDEQVQANYRTTLTKRYGVSCIGGIELLTSPKDRTVEDLIKHARLMDLGRGSLINQEGNFELVQKAGVADKIVTNTLQTMEAAGQLEYLRESALIDQKWKVVIEIHYYRERDQGMTAFHKDTTGKTLFVNLNFLSGNPETKETLLGPEYILNPPTNTKYEKWLERAGNLPSVFTDDLKSARGSLAAPTMIEATRVPAKGFVAFVDELIHHKTPTRGHRTANEIQVASILRASGHKQDLTSAEAAREQLKQQQQGERGESALSSLLPKEWAEAKSAAWQKIMLTLQNSIAFDRDQLATILPEEEFPDRDKLIDRMIEKGGFSDFGKVDLLHAASDIYDKAQNVEVKPSGADPLKRRMSQWLASDKAKGENDKKEMPPQRPATERRSFFRTWVRVEKR